MNRILLAAVVVSLGTAPCFSQEQKPEMDFVTAAGHLFRMQITKCWEKPPVKERVRADISIKLKPNGMLDGEPKALTKIDTPESQVIIASAIDALSRCQPFTVPRI